MAQVIPPEQDYEARLTKLEADKNKAIEEKENYRKAYLKASDKNEIANESDDERVRRFVQEGIAESRLLEIAREQDEIIRAAVKENKELKLAQLNKNGAPVAAIGTHSEGMPVRDTAITPEQMAHFKSQGKDDKWIENYKKNLAKKR